MSEIVEIKEYIDDYKNKVKDLIFDVYENERGRHRIDRPDLSAVKETYQDDGGNFWMALSEGSVVGTIGLMNQGNKKASMHRFCVAKVFRGKEKGVSAKLYSTFLEFARKKGYRKIFLGTGLEAKAAIKFYEKNGFIKIESLPEDMDKSLSLSRNELFYELDL